MRSVSASSVPAEAAAAHVVLAGVRMAYDGREVFRSLSCRFPRGRISVILGGSGSGKSTVLRLIGGLVHPLSGGIEVDGQDITRLGERKLYAVRQKLGMMFQGGALLDSMTVFDNLAFPLREHTRMSEAEIAGAVHETLAAVGLNDVDRLLPGQLSGGMTKRVALARAIIHRPVILLCDEPFSGLDPISARRIEALLGSINERFGMTMIVVSHHVASTMRMAAHVLVLLPDGAVEGSPAELRESSDPRIMSFLREDIDESLALVEAQVEVAPGR
jgi:phospholipid/cholesterol/gamma-HCH transport system ATP-binding protein